MSRRRLERSALAVAILGGIACLLAVVLDRSGFLRSWLVAVILWIAVPLGAMPVLMVHNLTGGGWGDSCRDILRAATATLPLFLLAFLPLLVGMHHVLEWTRPLPLESHLLAAKSFYLNVPFLLLRFIFYFVVWLWLAWRLVVGQGSTPLSAAGLLLWGFTGSFFSFDWLMSLQPLWYSDIFGLLWLSGNLTALFGMLFLTLQLIRPDAEAAEVARRQDLANLWLALVLTWIFLAFSQYLVIWYGNLPHEIEWYTARLRGGWYPVAGLVLLLYFILPFAVLLFSPFKRSGKVMLWLALLVLAGHVVNTWWMVAPAYSPGQLVLRWSDPVAILTLGAIWLLWYLHYLPEEAAHG